MLVAVGVDVASGGSAVGSSAGMINLYRRAMVIHLRWPQLLWLRGMSALPVPPPGLGELLTALQE
jgi:hypothetical protein